MIESEKRFEETKKVNCEKSLEHLKTIIENPSGLRSILKNFPLSEDLKKNSSNKKLRHYDMQLQANQANLKCSSSYVNNIKQAISINSSIHERYHKLQKISLHHILSKGS